MAVENDIPVESVWPSFSLPNLYLLSAPRRETKHDSLAHVP